MARLTAFVLLFVGVLALGANGERLLLYHFDPTRVAPAEAGLPNVQEVTRDGLVLWTAAPARGKPTILYFHGNAGNLANRAGRFRAFLARGYGLVAMAYPGSSGSTGPQQADAIQKQAEALYRTLPGLVGSGPVILYGESLGTGVAVALTASTAADEVKGIGPPVAMVLEAPYTSILDIGRQAYPALDPLFDVLPDRWISRRWIANRDIPLLILHGTNDQVVPFEMGQTLYDLSAAKDKTLIAVPGAGHQNIWQPDAQRALYRFLARF